MKVPLSKKTDALTNAILDLGPKDQMAVEWSDKKPEGRGLSHGAPGPAGGRRLPDPQGDRQGARKTIDMHIFRLDQQGDREGAARRRSTRGVVVRTLIAHTQRRGEKALRKLEQRLLAIGATVSRTADDLVRYHGKMMIVDRRRLYVLGFNLTRARHRQEPQPRHRDAQARRSCKEALRAVRRRLRPQAVQGRRPLLPGEPRQLARAAGALHQGREEAAADLRRAGHGQRDDPAPAGAR